MIEDIVPLWIKTSKHLVELPSSFLLIISYSWPKTFELIDRQKNFSVLLKLLSKAFIYIFIITGTY